MVLPLRNLTAIAEAAGMMSLRLAFGDATGLGVFSGCASVQSTNQSVLLRKAENVS